jgi:hypothetical protein
VQSLAVVCHAVVKGGYNFVFLLGVFKRKA